MAVKGKRTFWVTSAPGLLHYERLELLNRSGFDCAILAGFQDVLAATAIARPSCIIIDTPENENPVTLKMIQDLALIPELNGVRFILSVVSRSSEAIRIAVSENFRDILPLNIPLITWMQRIYYTTAAKATNDFPAPLCEVTMNQVAIVRAPARVIWINETHIRIECRGNQRNGSTMQISGQIAQAFGVPHLSLTVETIHKNQLMFRFSQAMVCRWRVAGAQSEKVGAMIRQLGAQEGESKLRAYVIVSDSNIRKSIATDLNPKRFELKIGLQRHTIASEIEYFSPDAIFVDDRILAAFTGQEFANIFEKLPADVPIIIYGKTLDKTQTQAMFRNRNLYWEQTAEVMHLHAAAQRYRVVPHAMNLGSDSKISQISAEHPWSKIEIHVPARLTSLNPSVGVISLPFSVGSFTLAKLEAPLLSKSLGRDPYIKITDSVEKTSDIQASQFNHQAHFYLADVELEEQVKLAQVLTAQVRDCYQKTYSPNLSIPQAHLSAAASIPTNAYTPPSAPPVPQPVAPPVISFVAPPAALTDFREEEFEPAEKIKQAVLKVSKELTSDWTKNIDMTVVKAVLTFAIIAGLAAYAISHASDSSYLKDHEAESQIFKNIANPQRRVKP